MYDLSQGGYEECTVVCRYFNSAPMYGAVRDAGVLCGMLVIGGRTNIEVR